LKKGESLGIVGESGSGKSTLALSILNLIPSPGKILGGEIVFNGKNILDYSEKEMINIRGNKISMIFQDPFSSLNPVFTIKEQLLETIDVHLGIKGTEALKKAVQFLDLVKIKDPEKRINDYPHEFSGGMRQRVMIAMALISEPEIIIADEPTTALDSKTQDEILELLKGLKAKFNFSILYITHNFSVVKKISERIIVMNQGEIVEEGETLKIFSEPKSPYTKELISALKELESTS